MMKRVYKIMAVIMAAVLLGVGCMVSVGADRPENTTKEEVVYVNLNGDGSVKEINVVNIFDLNADGKIIDYGKYTKLRNMTTTDEIHYDNDSTVTIDAKAGKLYYEGKLDSTVIPWNIAIRYYLNGKETPADKLAGKSGLLAIMIEITKNEACAGNFFEDQALQTVVTLDTGICSNIVADGATIVNVGNDKQLTYTILPGEGAKFSISTEVKNFKMNPIAVNGVRMNLGIAEELLSGISSLTGGISTLDAGSKALTGGLTDIVAKNKDLVNGANTAYAGMCDAAASQINAELQKNGMSPIKLTPSTYAKVLGDLLNTLDKNGSYQNAYNTGVAKVKQEVAAKANEVYAGYIDSIADEVYRTYLNSQSNMVYTKVCAQLLTQNLRLLGMSAEQAAGYVNSALGQRTVETMVAAMTPSQKADAMDAAVNSLTDDEKAQIKAGAVNQLSTSQKKQIESAYIDKVLKSQEFANEIAGSLSNVANGVDSIVRLKGMLDDYGVFVSGLQTYTKSVGEVKDGAQKLSDGINELQQGVNTLGGSADGSAANNGAEIAQAISGNTTPVSFVSSDNTNITSLQFVMQTNEIAPERNQVQVEKKEKLNFWQKLLRLFGLY
ncbi:MAG: hypothetical protein IKI29_06570 [Clostridia bacterium]|nr:hypothetical protein [Clostridia bacterium]